MIIARGHDSPGDGRLALILGLAAAAAGILAWIVVARADLVLSHYDARAHLVVARRVFDSITPGWKQLGAVWLPLPHLINLLPTQVDFFYRTGAFATCVSIACFGIAAWAAARLVLRITGSPAGAVTSTALLALNPNLLYLQATPMTEPLLIAVTFTLVLWLVEWLDADVDSVPTKLGWVLFAAAWTRYEAWLVIAAALALTTIAMWRGGHAWHTVLRRATGLALWPAAAALLFLINGRIATGSWFVTGGFYEIDPIYDHRPLKSLIAVWWGTHRQSGYVVESVALVSAATIVRRGRLAASIPLALFATGALPFYAFFEGHPFRVRYMIPTAAACAVFAGLGIGYLSHRQRRTILAAAMAVLIGSLAIESPLWDPQAAPMVQEAQWDLPRDAERRVVTECLVAGYRGEKVMASMASLAHYMQGLSAHGFHIRDFLHEGNGTIWTLALETGPAPHVGWLLVEEQSEGGDVIARRIKRDAAFLRDMTRVCEGGGVALYRNLKSGK